jgi:ABC-type branched-subunit amino acid transport system ATPase component
VHADWFKAGAAIRGIGFGSRLVELNAHQSQPLADRAHLIDNGRVAGAGTAGELARIPSVQAADLRRKA